MFVATEGPAIVFEYGAKAHLAEGIPTVDEVRPARPWYYFVGGNRYREQAGNRRAVHYILEIRKAL